MGQWMLANVATGIQQMRRRLAFLWLLLCTQLVHGQVLKTSGDLRYVLDAIVTSTIDFSKTPGLVVGIIEQDSQYVFAYGRRDKAAPQPPDGHTIFELGAATKVFTAMIAHRLQQEGLLRYTDTIGTYFRGGLPLLRYKGHAPTVLDLLRHTAGLPKLPTNFGQQEAESTNPYGRYTYRHLYEFVTTHRLTASVAEVYRHSHTGYAVLTKILEGVTGGTSYYELLRRYVTTPLGLLDTGVVLSEEQYSQLAPGYTRSGEPTSPWTFESFEGAMGLKSTAYDLLRVLRAHLDDPLWADMQVPQLPLRRRGEVLPAVGWQVIPFPRNRYYPIVTHGGVTRGHRCYLLMVQATRTAVVVLANSAQEIDSFGLLVLQMLNHDWRKKP